MLVNSNLKCSDLRPCVVTNGGTGVEDGIMGAQVNSVIQCTYDTRLARTDVHAQMPVARRCALAMHSGGRVGVTDWYAGDIDQGTHSIAGQWSSLCRRQTRITRITPVTGYNMAWQG